MKTIDTVSGTLGYTLDTYGVFSASDAIEDEDWTDDTEFDHKQYVKDLAEHQVDILNNYTNDIVKSFKVTGAYSPSYYNFSTDNSELQIELVGSKLLDYIKANLTEFKEYLNEEFTSRSGFSSFVPNNWTEFWYEANGSNKVDSDRAWAIMLGWYMRRELLTEDEYINEMYENLHEIAYNNASNLAEVE